MPAALEATESTLRDTLLAQESTLRDILVQMFREQYFCLKGKCLMVQYRVDKYFKDLHAAFVAERDAILLREALYNL